MNPAMTIPDDRPLRVLFVCTGNICRSPTAEAVARRLFSEAGLAGRVEFDSAGTHGYHVGEAADSRTRQAAARQGYDLSPMRARKLEPADFTHFDLLLAMDRSHLEFMRKMNPSAARDRAALFLACAGQGGVDEVPDPYYGGARGFDLVLELCEAGVSGLLECTLKGAGRGSAVR